MIRYALHCHSGHDFDGWFRSADDFDTQLKRGLVSCPECGSAQVEKALMAPSVSTGRKQEKIALAMGEQQRQMLEQLQSLSRKLRENAEDVGDRFADEARKIHFGETAERAIYGEASPDQVRDLIEDGVGVMPLPPLPEDRN